MKKAADSELNFEKRYRLAREVVETLVLTILLFLVIRLAVQNFTIDGSSMEPTLHNAELILVDKWSYIVRPPARGDVIVFVAPPNPSEDYIKRIIGVPGDVISIQNTTVTVNGSVLHESYVDPRRQGNPYPSFTNRVVPPGDYFVLGDNRIGSSDSRDWGCVPRQNIVGRAAFVYWPLGTDNDGLLHNAAAVFKNVRKPPVVSTDPCMVLQGNGQVHGKQGAPIDHGPDLNTAFLLLLPSLLLRKACRRRSGRIA